MKHARARILTLISLTNCLTPGENDDDVVISAKQAHKSKKVIKEKGRAVQNIL